MSNSKYNYQGKRENLSSEQKYTSKEAQEFWRNPKKANEHDVGKNDPNDYLTFDDGRSEMLFEKIHEILPDRDIKILELGPNAGRNLNFLYKKGYENVHGIEINADAVNLMEENFPYISKNITLSSIEDGLQDISNNDFDLVFTMAVLEHVSTESDFIFDDIKRISSEFIITIEDEVTSWSERHFQRNYKKVFESESWEEIFSANCEEFNCLDDRFFIRVFKNLSKT